MSPDPGWFMFANILNPQSLNLYNYALDNPLAFIDIDGLELVRVVLSNGQSVVLDRSIADEVISLVDEANNAGLRVTVTSGFRSNARQAQLYNAWVSGGRRGNPVARPGHSGHNSGQSIDIGTGRLSPAQRNQLGGIAGRNGLPYAGARDTVHFGAGFGNPIDPVLVQENNAHPYPDTTIVDGTQNSDLTTTVIVTDTTTVVDMDNTNLVPDLLIPIQPPPPLPAQSPDQSQDHQ